MKTTSEVAEIADFIVQHGKGLYEETERPMIERFIDSHIGYGTLMIIRDQSRRIVAAVRWNWVAHDTAKILDLVIRGDFRNKALLRDMLIRAKLAMPQLQALTFNRKRHGKLTTSTYLINDFIGGYHVKR